MSPSSDNLLHGPLPGPTPSCSQGQHHLNGCSLGPRSAPFRRLGNWRWYPYGASPETQARAAGPKDNTLSPGTGSQVRSLSPQLSYPPSQLEVPMKAQLRCQILAPRQTWPLFGELPPFLGNCAQPSPSDTTQGAKDMKLTLQRATPIPLSSPLEIAQHGPSSPHRKISQCQCRVLAGPQASCQLFYKHYFI